jgi:predicted LPLAT superfamily acyltransferase
VSRQRHWNTIAERGSTAGMRFTVWIYRRFGLGLATILAWPVVAYFVLTDARGRRASRRYLERLATWAGPRSPVPARPRLPDTFRHYWEFGLSILDRLSLWSNRSGFRVEFHGRHHIQPFLEAKRGAILLGAHLGSFDVLRVLGARYAVTVNVLMSRRHASRISSVFKGLSADIDANVIELQQGSPASVFTLKACLERGQFVAILGDRVGAGPRSRMVPLDFLGHPAPFPWGPFRLASRLGCPVLFMVAIRLGPTTYEVFVEPLTDGGEVSPDAEDTRARELMEAYVHRLEAYCLRAPYQWFNFYDYWLEDCA